MRRVTCVGVVREGKGREGKGVQYVVDERENKIKRKQRENGVGFG